MSRSYKKFPQVRDNLWGKSLKQGKKYCNRMIRHKLKNIDLDIGNYKDYKRFSLSSYDMWEYKLYQTKQDAIKDWYQVRYDLVNGVRSYRSWMDTSLDDAINDWYKFYKSK